MSPYCSRKFKAVLLICHFSFSGLSHQLSDLLCDDDSVDDDDSSFCVLNKEGRVIGDLGSNISCGGYSTCFSLTFNGRDRVVYLVSECSVSTPV